MAIRSNIFSLYTFIPTSVSFARKLDNHCVRPIKFHWGSCGSLRKFNLLQSAGEEWRFDFNLLLQEEAED